MTRYVVIESPEQVEGEWQAFMAELRARLDAGAAAYGDKSFSRPARELLAELRQEALDLAGWGFVLFVKLRQLERAAVRVDDEEMPDPDALPDTDPAPRCGYIPPDLHRRQDPAASWRPCHLMPGHDGSHEHRR